MSFTPHSFRSFLPSSLKAIGTPEGEMKWLSAWNAKGSDGYIRTARTISQSMQAKLSEKIRDKNQPPVGEVEIIDRVKTNLLKRGTSQEAANEVVGKLRGQNEPPNQKTQCNAIEEEEASESEEREPPKKGYVVSFSRKRKLRRLHWLGKCHRFPGLDYKNWAYLGEAPPDASLYDAKCLQCWREKSSAAKSRSSSSSSGATTSSSTDSE